jgi:hypothetical protein
MVAAHGDNTVLPYRLHHLILSRAASGKIARAQHAAHLMVSVKTFQRMS